MKNIKNLTVNWILKSIWTFPGLVKKLSQIASCQYKVAENFLKILILRRSSSYNWSKWQNLLKPMMGRPWRFLKCWKVLNGEWKNMKNIFRLQ